MSAFDLRKHQFGLVVS